MMSRNVRCFMSLFHVEKPVVCKVHGFCVAGGTDMALCSDLLVIEDDAKIGYPPARVWGAPTTAVWVHRSASRRRSASCSRATVSRARKPWSGGSRSSTPRGRARRAVRDAARAHRADANQPARHDEAARQSSRRDEGLHTTQIVGTVFDGITRHTKEGYAFQRRAAEAGFKQAVRERDEPFGDLGNSTFKG